MQLRNYQLQGKAAIYTEWEAADIIMFVLATGGGKTVTFVEVARDFVKDKKRVMLVAHREELILQAQQTLFTQGLVSGIIKADYPVRYELPVQVASIQTIARRKNLPKADLIIVDEGHHVQDDNTYGKLLAAYPEAKILIVTATPYRLSGKGFTNICPGRDVKLIVNCTTKDLINDGWLVPIEYYVGAIPDFSGIPIIKGEYSEAEASAEMQLAPLVESYLRDVKGKQGICFCVDVNHSLDTVKKYLAAGIRAVHVDANTPDDVRKQIFRDFRARLIDIVCNVGILTEGADFPLCEFVQLAAPTKSLSKVLQEIGRCLRLLPGIVDGLNTAEERRAAIAASDKPFGIVLDNAGLFLDHGFPDDDHDWRMYFSGWKKQKEAKPDENAEMIEMLLFEIEDPQTKERRVTENVKETEGMILVKITKELRENLKQSRHLKEFEKIYERALADKQIGKPGYYAAYRFIEYCKRKNIQITDSAWKYLKFKLATDIERQIEEYIAHSAQLGKKVIAAVNKDIAMLRSRGVSHHWLHQMKKEYKENHPTDLDDKSIDEIQAMVKEVN